MSPRPVPLLVALLLLVPVAAALTNRVVNGDFETAGSGPGSIPGWTSDGSNAFRAENQGVGGSDAALLVGVATLRSAQTFAVTATEVLNFSVDVWEARDDMDDRTTSVRGDSVAALVFLTAAGGSTLQLEFHCDAYVDLLDDDTLNGSDSCTARDGYVTINVPDPSITCGANAECLKYREPIVVPTGATRAYVILGGSSARDGTPSGPGLTTPTSLTYFDNVVVGN